jgi:hypothetical protein
MLKITESFSRIAKLLKPGVSYFLLLLLHLDAILS